LRTQIPETSKEQRLENAIDGFLMILDGLELIELKPGDLDVLQQKIQEALTGV